MTDLTTIIYNALIGVEYSGPADDNRLLAAIQDLATDYPKERKVIQHAADHSLLQICSEAITSDERSRGVLEKKVSQYLQQNHLIAEAWANDISKAMIGAFARYGGQETPSPLQAIYEPESIEETEEPSKKQKRRVSKKGKVLIAIAAVIVITAGVWVAGFGHAVKSMIDNTFVSQTYTEEGVSFTLPGTRLETCFYGNDENEGSDSLIIGELDLYKGSLKKQWEWDYSAEDEFSDFKPVDKGMIEIDGEECYWTSHHYGGKEWSKGLYLPHIREDRGVYISISSDTLENLNKAFEGLTNNIQFKDSADGLNQDDNNGELSGSTNDAYEGSYISRFGITFPDYGMKLWSCSYDGYDSMIDYNFSELGDLTTDFEEELDFSKYDGNTILNKGETEIAGGIGKWFDYETVDDSGDTSYDYELLFKHNDSIVYARYHYYDNSDHSAEIEKINSSIHFED